MKTVKTVIVIGNGKAAIDFVRILREYVPGRPRDTAARVELVLVDAANSDPWTTSLGDYCERHSLRYLASDRFNGPEVLKAVEAVGPDLAISVNNHQILRSTFLSVPKEGVINFHNSVLPRYGGLNACTWAIANGEREHGVTLHHLDTGVDTGDIVAQTIFPLGENTTAVQLIMRCLQEGTRLFARTLPEILNGTLPRVPQDPTQRTFYRKTEIPRGGRVDFGGRYEPLHNLIRSLDFHPLANPLAHPRAEYRGRPFGIDKIAIVERTTHHLPGTFVEASGDRLHVQVQDAVIRILRVRDEDGQPIPVRELIARYQIDPGATMANGNHATGDRSRS